MLQRLLLIFVVMTLSLTAAEGARPKANSKERTAATIRRERKEADRKAQETRGRIDANEAKAARNLAKIEMLNAEIKAGNARISVLKNTTDSAANRYRILEDSVGIVESRVTALKNSYAASLRAIRAQRQATPSQSLYILSAPSFSAANKRMRYLSELNSMQKMRAIALSASVAELDNRRAVADSLRRSLDASLQQLQRENHKLEGLHANANNVAADLRRQDASLRKALKSQQEKIRRLDEELNRIIEAEAAEAARIKAEKAKKEREEMARKEQQQKEDAAKAKGSGPVKPTPAQPPKPVKENANTPVKTPSTPAKTQTPVAATFAEAKGKLPMPVSGNAIIVSDFGRHTHESLGRVELMNNGIDIETTPGSHAVAVYPGTVTMVIQMDGYGNVVLVRHGEYLTVYAGLSSLNVRKGQDVKAGENLGKLYADASDGNRTRLHFEVRHEKEKLDPAEWLR